MLYCGLVGNRGRFDAGAVLGASFRFFPLSAMLGGAALSYSSLGGDVSLRIYGRAKLGPLPRVELSVH